MLDDDQLIALSLAGTVRLPSPTPATGSISADLPDRGAPFDPSAIYLRLTHRPGPRMKIMRIMRLSDIRAISGHWFDPMTGIQEADISFHTEASIRTTVQGLIAQTVEPALAWPMDAAVYLPEAAPVLMRVEVGLTAAASADYYPPLKGSYSPPCHPEMEPDYPQFEPCHPMEPEPPCPMPVEPCRPMEDEPPGKLPMGLCLPMDPSQKRAAKPRQQSPVCQKIDPRTRKASPRNLGGPLPC